MYLPKFFSTLSNDIRKTGHNLECNLLRAMERKDERSASRRATGVEQNEEMLERKLLRLKMVR